MNNYLDWLEYIKDVKRISSRKIQQNKSTNNFELTNSYTPSFKQKPAENIIKKLDLHGLTEDQAFGMLKAFIEKAFANRIKEVLVVTGKGREDKPGIIKLALPRWLEYTEISNYIISYAKAGHRMGGDGAFLIRLKKPK